MGYYKYTDAEMETLIKFGEQLAEQSNDVRLQDAAEQAKKYIELRKRGLRSELETDEEIKDYIEEKEAQARAQILELIGDLPEVC